MPRGLGACRRRPPVPHHPPRRPAPGVLDDDRGGDGLTVPHLERLVLPDEPHPARGRREQQVGTDDDEPHEQPRPHRRPRRPQHDGDEAEEEQRGGARRQRHQRGTGTDARTLCSTEVTRRALELGLGAQHEAVGERRDREGLDVVGRHVAPPAEPGPGPARGHERRGATRGDPEREGRGGAGGPGDVDDVADDLGGDLDRAHGGGARLDVGRGGHRPDARGGEVAGVEAVGVPAEHGHLVVPLGDRQHDLEEEAVELGLGQRVGALVLDGVLRRGHEERRGQRGAPCRRRRPAAPPSPRGAPTGSSGASG